MNGKKNHSVAVGLLKVAFFTVLIAVIFFVCAGRLDQTMAWIFFILGAINTGGVSAIIGPGLIKEREGLGKDAKKWDIIPAIIVGRIGPILIIILSGFDIRFGWTGQISLTMRIIALAVVFLGFLLTDWAIISNNFFSGVVRIQKDRGHSVVSAGPYKYVRHPGYSGSILWSLATPPLLGSLWALTGAAFYILVIIIRTVLEDKTLQKELEGYKNYSGRVKYRLMPGIW
jgi:protein-S-isoprenylcysteine O-methyltransferase Ste14